MASIGIKTEEIQNYAERITEKNNVMKACVSELQRHVEGIRGIWDSPASERLISQITSMYDMFESYGEYTQNYASYLENVAANYEHLDTLISSRVDGSDA